MNKNLSVFYFFLNCVFSGLAIASDHKFCNIDTVRGEALTFRGEEERAPLFDCSDILLVYSFDRSGNRVIYRQGEDFAVSGCKIKRISNKMPDVFEYSYVNKSGKRSGVLDYEKFQFFDKPQRNPPDLMTYTVYVDYILSQAVPWSLKGKKNYKNIVLYGDSIAGGAHTVSKYFHDLDYDSFFGKIKSSFPGPNYKNVYKNGGSLYDVLINPSKDVESTPDLVLVEFGMNDHVSDVGPTHSFEPTLDKTVKFFLQRNADVLLIGFFKQNPRWDLEDPDASVAYNNSIRKVAEANNVDFIDVNATFDALVERGKRLEDLTGDYMHHPNNYGHAIYYSLIAPYLSARSGCELELIPINMLLK